MNALVAIRRLPETSPDHGGIGQPARGAAGDVASERTAELERAGTLDGPQPGTPLESESELTFEPGPAPGRRTARRRARRGPRSIAPAIVRLITVSFVGMVAFSGFEATFALLTDARFGLKLSGTGAVFTVIGLALVVVQVGHRRPGQRPAGRVGHPAGRPELPTPSAWRCWPSTGDGPRSCRSLTFLVLGQGLITPTLSSAVAGRAGRARGTWLGWQQSAGGLARVLGPITAGALFQHIGVGSPYVVGAVLALIALSLVPGGAPVADPSASTTPRRPADPSAEVVTPDRRATVEVPPGRSEQHVDPGFALRPPRPPPRALATGARAAAGLRPVAQSRRRASRLSAIGRSATVDVTDG